ncbi:myosin-10-like [Penaeus japonicus]|uniref:myosin-10-like n=1 Tax=Penaeus japonicus TaxID=27405 RepID=UPI001C70C7FF|nr:myosin-10-like [Penaeus japonicus]
MCINKEKTNEEGLQSPNCHGEPLTPTPTLAPVTCSQFSQCRPASPQLSQSRDLPVPSSRLSQGSPIIPFLLSSYQRVLAPTLSLSLAPASEMLFVLVLLSCCASGWAAAVPQDEDLQSSIIFNQLAIAQVLDNLKNLSNGDATVTTHLEQLSQNQKTQLQQVNEGLARVISSVDLLSQAMTSHLQHDEGINLGTFMPSELMEQVVAEENQIQDLIHQNNQTAATIQQLEEQSLQLQNEVDLALQEIQQKDDLISRINGRIRRLRDENLQLAAKGNDTEAREVSLRAEIQALKNQVTQSKARYTQQQAIKTQLDEQVAELESDKNELQQQMSQLDEGNEQLRQRKVAAEGEKKALLEKKANLTEAKEMGLAKISSLQPVVDELKETSTNLESLIELLSRKKGSAEGELTRLKTSLSTLTAKRNPMKMKMERSIQHLIKCL